MDRFGLAHRISRKQDRLLDRLRDRRADEAAGLPGTAHSFAARGVCVARHVPALGRAGAHAGVWFGLLDGRLYVESLADAGKVKRLGHDRRVRVAPGTVRGKPKGAFAEGVGRILGAAEEEIGELALDRHYGLRRRLYVRLGARLGVRSVYLELTPSGLDRA